MGYHPMMPTNYKSGGEKENNPGRGWVMVNSEELTSDAITRAMMRGDFYSSSGVMLEELVRGTNSIETLSQ